MTLLTITLPTGLFIFFLMLAMIIGILVMAYAASSAISASYGEPTRDEIREQFYTTQQKQKGRTVRMFFKKA